MFLERRKRHHLIITGHWPMVYSMGSRTIGALFIQCTSLSSTFGPCCVAHRLQLVSWIDLRSSRSKTLGIFVPEQISDQIRGILFNTKISSSLPLRLWISGLFWIIKMHFRCRIFQKTPPTVLQSRLIRSSPCTLNKSLDTAFKCEPLIIC